MISLVLKFHFVIKKNNLQSLTTMKWRWKSYETVTNHRSFMNYITELNGFENASENTEHAQKSLV